MTPIQKAWITRKANAARGVAPSRPRWSRGRSFTVDGPLSPAQKAWRTRRANAIEAVRMAQPISRTGSIRGLLAHAPSDRWNALDNAETYREIALRDREKNGGSSVRLMSFAALHRGDRELTKAQRAQIETELRQQAAIADQLAADQFAATDTEGFGI